MERRFRKQIEALDEIFEFLQLFVDEEDLDGAASYVLQLVTDELFSNAVKYGSGRGEVGIRISKDGSELRLVLDDFDTDPFDPASLAEVDTGRPVEEREPGGLGLHLVKTLVDRISYEYEDRTLRITVIKKLEI